MVVEWINNESLGKGFPNVPSQIREWNKDKGDGYCTEVFFENQRTICSGYMVPINELRIIED
jgi:hypothetical protein